MNIGLFCSSSNDIAEVYSIEAAEIAAFIGKKGHTLVYGGSDNGLMKVAAQTVLENGGNTIGIIPVYMQAQVCEFAEQVFMVDSLGDRKELLKEHADVCIALAGGFGTLDELFDVLASAQTGEYDGQIIIVNTNGFYNPLKTQFEAIYSEKFGKESNKSLYSFVNNASECIKTLTDSAL